MTACNRFESLMSELRLFRVLKRPCVLANGKFARLCRRETMVRVKLVGAPTLAFIVALFSGSLVMCGRVVLICLTFS